MLENHYYSYKPGIDIPIDVARPTFRQLAAEAKSTFAGTGFVTGGDISRADLGQIPIFYWRALIVSPHVFNKGTLWHLWLTARVAREIGVALNIAGFDLNLNQLEALGWFHDIGRTLSHRRHIHEKYGDLLMKRAGFTGEFRRLFPQEAKWMPVMSDWAIDDGESRRKLLDLGELVSYPQRGIVEIADIMSKVRGHRLISWAEFEAGSLINRQLPPDKSSMWRSEYYRQLNIQYRFNDGSIMDYYRNLVGWFESNSKRKIQDVLDEVSLQILDEGVLLPDKF